METSLLALGVSTGSGTLAAAASGVSFDDCESEGNYVSIEGETEALELPASPRSVSCATHLTGSIDGALINVPIREQDRARFACAKPTRGGSGGNRRRLDA